ncbi:MAG: hypothetical protein NVS3B21_13590 [Acidimicrobiales bacterium]
MLVIVTAHVIVSPPTVPMLLHWLTVAVAAPAAFPPAKLKTSARASMGPRATTRDRRGMAAMREIMVQALFLAVAGCDQGASTLPPYYFPYPNPESLH